jgi:hypothetical protein
MSSRSPQPLGTDLERTLSRYVMAAGASVVALAASANARIIYTPVFVDIPPNTSPYQLDLNHDGISDFTITNAFSPPPMNPMTGSTRYWTNYSIQLQGNESQNAYLNRAVSTSRSWAAAMPADRKVGPDRQFIVFPKNPMAFCGQACAGPWLKQKNRFLGLRFSIHGKAHFGWARMSVLYSGKGHFTVRLKDYAYETVANKVIRTGDNGTGDTLGRLALGAAERQ